MEESKLANSIAQEHDQGEASVFLHPVSCFFFFFYVGRNECGFQQLVFINIADHCTRTGGGSERILGGIFGIQQGRNIDVLDSIELLFKSEADAVIIDATYLEEQKDLCNICLKEKVVLTSLL